MHRVKNQLAALLVNASAASTGPEPSFWEARRRLKLAVLAACLLVVTAGATIGGLAAAGKLKWRGGGSDSGRALALGTPAFRGSLRAFRQASQLAAPLTADVVVIGAGIAGLAAARRLAEGGVDVLVLEGRMRGQGVARLCRCPFHCVLARVASPRLLLQSACFACFYQHPSLLPTQDRVGGRVHTVSHGGASAELGAMVVRGAASNPLTHVANRLDIQRQIIDPSSERVYGASGAPLGPLPLKQLQQAGARLAAVARRAQDAGAAGDVPLGSVVDRVARELGLVSGQQGQKAVEGLLLDYWVVSRVEQRYAAPAEQLSARYFDLAAPLEGVDDLMTGGAGALTEGLAQGLPISLGQVVSRVALGPDNITVVTQAGAVYTAQYVFCTAALGVLQSGGITFEPGLHPATALALGRLGAGALEQVALWFDQVFWVGDAGGREYLGFLPLPESEATPPRWTRFLSLASFTRQPVLVGFVAGQDALALESMGDEEVVKSALATLRRAYGGGAVPQPRHAAVSRWQSDPLTRGALSYYPVGSSPDDRATLQQPVGGALLFAGEAAWDIYPGTLHGAYLSGKQQADAILQARQAALAAGTAGAAAVGPAGQTSGET